MSMTTKQAALLLAISSVIHNDLEEVNPALAASLADLFTDMAVELNELGLAVPTDKSFSVSRQLS